MTGHWGKKIDCQSWTSWRTWAIYQSLATANLLNDFNNIIWIAPNLTSMQEVLLKKEHQSTQILMNDSRSHKESISFNLSKGIMASPEVRKSKSYPSIQSLASSSSGQQLASPQEFSVRKILHRNKEKHFVSNKDISFQNLDRLFKRRDHEKILITVPNIPASSKPVSDSCFRLTGGTPF